MDREEATLGRIRHRVIYGDTDAAGVVYYGTYMRYLEVGRVELLRAHGLIHSQLEAQSLVLPVREVHLRYRRSARYDDLLEIRTQISELRRAGLRFEYELHLPEQDLLLATGYTRHACFDRAQQKVVGFPPELSEVLARAAAATARGDSSL